MSTTGRGRPTKFKPEFAKQARKLCLLGATDIELADFFEVDVATIYRWKHTHERFCEALRLGKEEADERVKRALFSKAVGYTFESEKIFTHDGEPVRVPIREHVPPSDTAAIFWLKNRDPDQWRDKTHLEADITTTVEPSDALANLGRVLEAVRQATQD